MSVLGVGVGSRQTQSKIYTEIIPAIFSLKNQFLILGTYMHFRCWGKTITNWLLEKEYMLLFYFLLLLWQENAVFQAYFFD